MSHEQKVKVRQDEAGTWIVEVPVPDRTKPAVLVAENEEAAALIAHFLEQKLAAGLLPLRPQ